MTDAANVTGVITATAAADAGRASVKPLVAIEAENFGVNADGRALLRGVHFRVAGEGPLVIVGESGAGKSTLARALAGLVEPAQTTGALRVAGLDLAAANAAALRAWRGRRASLAVQDAHRALNPQHTLLAQVAEPLRLHRAMGRRQAEQAAAGLLASLGLDTALHRRYPAQCSGGQLQRALLAMALAPEPELLVLDEPTSALDADLRERVLVRLHDEARQRRLVVVTHDLELARALQGQTLVLYGGCVMESGPSADLLHAPRHPYTRGLLRAWPHAGGKDLQGIPGHHEESEENIGGCPFASRCSQRIARCAHERPVPDANGVACLRGGIVAVLQAQGLTQTVDGQSVLRGASLRVDSGETVAITGASGAGKSTLARILAGLQCADGGTLHTACTQDAENADSGGTGGLGWVPQNAAGSVPLHFTVLQAVAEPLAIRGHSAAAQQAAARQALADVGLPAHDAFLARRTRRLSGGELQRLAIARALITQPALLIADEPTAALDASVQAKVLRLFLHLQETRGLALLLITHDLPVARHVADRILRLEGGVLTPVAPAPEDLSGQALNRF